MTTVAFFGSHPLGARCLERLHDHDGIDVSVVVTYPPDHDGWWDESVNELAHRLGYPVLTREEAHRATEYPVDYLLSVYYPDVLGPNLLAHPDVAPINLHQAELPRYRGSNVFSHSIMNARADDHWKHGTTMHVMAESVDAGDVIARRFAEIRPDDTARTLYDRVHEVSVELFEEMLPKFVSGELLAMATPQAEFDGERYFYSKASLDGLKEIPAAELADEDGQTELYDRIRALDFPPHEPAYTRVDGEKVYLTLGR
ncbi:methionyl-tRNA formyltransferase [Halogeometricum limi]|uniref:Methionyl-tRNA formyltransferase n=1 Tax=Halogeometricum limi TaxID=555875 RepID=A0A1I6HTK8_9EURY|nr:formyltransferase family protein [Halogeometricum limi]SFR57763.1 methionyl-tRNA formyltransferase [Halogeometricum limi]